MIRKKNRPSLGSAISAAAGALQHHLLLQQMKSAEERRTEPASVKNSSSNDALGEQYAGIVFSGNPHETVPRGLLLDDRLSPLERNVWQVFRLLINADGVTAFPTYDQLRPYLGSTPGKPASRETVAKALTVLRLTRWLSLGRRVRDSLSGRVQGNVYILHDEPVGCAEAMEIDRDYMLLIGQSLDHASKTVQLVADHVFKEFAADPHYPGAGLPTRLDVIEERWRVQGLHYTSGSADRGLGDAEFGIRTQGNRTVQTLSSESELSENQQKANEKSPSSDSELSLESMGYGLVRNPNSYSTYTNTNTSVCKSSVPREDMPTGLQLPASFAKFTPEQSSRALTALERVDANLRQSLLDQWQHRCNSGGVKNPFGYLLSCMQKALRGEFNAGWQAPPSSTPPAYSPPKPPPLEYKSASPAPVTTPPRREPPSTPERDANTLAAGRSSLLGIKQIVRPRTSE